MHKSTLIAFIVFLILAVEPLVYPEQSSPNKNILILFSFAPNRPANRVILEDVMSKLTQAFGDSYNLHMEYLETETFPNGPYPKSRFDLYNEKYRNNSLDLLICIGVGIVPIIKSYAEPYLLEIPTISLDYDFSSYGYTGELVLNDRTVLIPLKVDAEKTVTSALELFPETKSVYFICGSMNYDKIFLDISKKAAERTIKNKNVTFISDVSMYEVLKTVNNLPPNSLIFVPAFNSDIKSVPYYNTEAVKLISEAANSPVFTFYDMGFGEGAVGGYMISFQKAGLLIGDLAIKILNGTDPSSIKVTPKDYYEYVLDWRELKRWNLLGSRLIPKGSMIMFEERTFLGKYKLIFGAGILFLIIQSFLIVNLVLMYRKQKVNTRRLIETENRYRELVREDRILIVGQMTASLSHELNQPLTAILSTAQAGLRFTNADNRDPELLKEIFQNIIEDDKRAAAIISSVRGMMKLEQRGKEKLNLNSLIQEAVAICSSEAIVQRLNLNVHLPDYPVMVMVDSTQIQQVILNLISNARQSMERIQMPNNSIDIVESVLDNTVTVSVRDHGEGIPRSVKDNLFKPFVTSKEEGIGIGLAISRSIIDSHQGKIWAENMPDGGAKFSFSLKFYEDE